MRSASLKISESALAEVERIYLASGLDRDGFVPALVKSYLVVRPSKSIQLDDPLHPNDSELAELSKKLAPRDPKKEPFEWVVGLYAVDRLEPEDIFLVTGIRFVLFPGVILEALESSLDYDDTSKRWILTRSTGG